ncbi:hypothetical protein [Acidianus sp. HS-5]|uniref:hypothetical protein n=1 Tax=Acidianus sp. HS-5 TaxID=2886040 RepID=UPI001F3BAF77|nr:hypothetical protein [Acidianus sp. HS-5]
MKNCIELPFLLCDEYLQFKDITIPLIFKEEKRKLVRLFLLLTLSTSHEIFNCCGSVKIFIDNKLSAIELDNIKSGFTKTCGNYGSTKLVYCISNENVAIMGKDKVSTEKAFCELKELLSLLSSINNGI